MGLQVTVNQFSLPVSQWGEGWRKSTERSCTIASHFTTWNAILWPAVAWSTWHDFRKVCVAFKHRANHLSNALLKKKNLARKHCSSNEVAFEAYAPPNKLVHVAPCTILHDQVYVPSRLKINFPTDQTWHEKVEMRNSNREQWQHVLVTPCRQTLCLHWRG